MYRSHFGLTDKPFSIAPDPSFLYMSERHREALAHLLYGVNSDSGFVLLTGDVGTGKTTICRCLLEQLPETSDVAYVINPRLSVSELLASVCDEFGISYNKEKCSVKEYVDLVNQYLLEAHANGRKPVLIIDEAQNLTEDVLEQIRLLTNLETNERKLLLIILIGQPELRDKLAKHDLRQLGQRITARYHLEALSKQETIAYIIHRLAVAGGRRKIFSAKAFTKIFKLSCGIPRLINLICDRVLLGAFTQGLDLIDVQTVKVAANEVFCEPKKKHRPFAIILPWALTCILVITGFVTYFLGNPFQQSLFANSNQTFHTPESALKTVGSNEDDLDGRGQEYASLWSASQFVYPMLWQSQKINYNSITLSSDLSDASDDIGMQPTVLNDPSILQDSAPITLLSMALEKPLLSEQTVQNLKDNQLQWPDEWPIARSKVLAFQALLKEWGAVYNPTKFSAACDQAETIGLRCLYNQGNMGSLRKMNRPAVLQMTSGKGQEYFATLVGLEQEKATLKLGSKVQRVSIADLEEQWSGGYTLLWQAPPLYERAVSPGGKAAWLPWLDQQLALLNGKPVTNNGGEILTGALLENVVTFQRQSGLMPDGIIGPQTIIYLNSLLASGAERSPILAKR